MATRFEISSSLLPENATVAAFHGSEGVSRPYVFDVYVVVTGGVEVDVDEAPGARATLTIDDHADAPVRFSGMIATIELLRAVSVNGKADQETCLYLVRIVPHLWQLSLTRHSRIWTKKTIPEVIKDVLDEEGVSDVSMRLNGSYEVEEHVCQYKESSLNFIHRWMEREGIYYFFEQSDTGETLVITDDKSTSSPSRTKPIPYHTGAETDVSSGAHLDLFTWRNDATPATVRFTDYDYSKPALDVVGKASVSKLGIGEQVTYGNRFFTPKQGDALAAIRADDWRARSKTYHAGGAVIGITSGYTFTLEHHPRSNLNADYFAVSVEHTGYAHGAESWGKTIPYEGTGTYRVDVVAISAEQQYRHPELAPWPRLDGFENAIVDGPATSEYAQIDDQGRYNLKFKFDEGTLRGGKASTWVRKMQPHAGTVEGWHFPERAGTEVVCAFLGGDPDRPIIVGAVPTMIHQSPVTSSNHTQNVIQTGGKNRFEMEDLSGQQRVTISTPHQKTFLHLGSPLTGSSQVFSGEGDEGASGAGSMSIEVPDHHAAIVSEGNALIMTDGDQDISSGGNWSVDIAENHVEKIGGNRVDEVTGYMHQTISETLDQDVHGAVSEEYHDTYTQGVTGDVTLTHNAKQTLTVAAETSWHTGTNAEWTVGGSLNIEVTGPHEIKSATWSESVWGAKHEFIGGLKMEEILGASTELLGGLKFEMVTGIDIGINLAGRIEVAPEKLEIYASPTKIEGEVTELKGAVQRLEGETTKIAGMETKLDGLETKTSGLETKTAGLENKTAGLESHVSTLQTQVNTLYDVNAGAVILL